MSVLGQPLDDQLRDLLLADRPWLGAAAWFDAHTHMGHADPDGMEADPDEVLASLDAAGHDRALLFAMQEPGGYPPANDAVLAACATAPERLQALCRVDPNALGAEAELERCLAAGAVGLKLHPRSDAFGLPHPVVDALVARVAEQRGVVLFHAGRGIPVLGAAAAALAERHPDVRIILAHAGISDLGALRDAAAALPNLLFDTAWWNAGDLLQLMTSIPPGQILYASDLPYRPSLSSSFSFLRCARQAGHAPPVVREMAGGQLARIVAGEAPADLGPAVGEGALGARSAPLERVTTHTSSAVQLLFRGGDASEALALARLGCQTTGGDQQEELLAVVDAVLARAEVQLRADPDSPRLAASPTLVAHLLAGTPGAGVPDVAL